MNMDIDRTVFGWMLVTFLCMTVSNLWHVVAFNALSRRLAVTMQVYSQLTRYLLKPMYYTFEISRGDMSLMTSRCAYTTAYFAGLAGYKTWKQFLEQSFPDATIEVDSFTLMSSEGIDYVDDFAENLAAHADLARGCADEHHSGSVSGRADVRRGRGAMDSPGADLGIEPGVAADSGTGGVLPGGETLVTGPTVEVEYGRPPSE